MVSNIDHTSNAVQEKLLMEGNKPQEQMLIECVLVTDFRLWWSSWHPYLLLDDAFPATAIVRECSCQPGSQWGCTVQHLELGLWVDPGNFPFPGHFWAELCLPCLVPTNPLWGRNLYYREDSTEVLVSGESSTESEQGNRELRDHLVIFWVCWALVIVFVCVFVCVNLGVCVCLCAPPGSGQRWPSFSLCSHS